MVEGLVHGGGTSTWLRDYVVHGGGTSTWLRDYVVHG